MDKELPNDIEVEKRVLGILISDNDSFLKIADIINYQIFYTPKHQKIFLAIESLFANNIRIDSLSVKAQLEKTNELLDIGGAYYLVTLSMVGIKEALSLNRDVLFLTELHVRRKLIEDSLNIYRSAFNLSIDIDETISETSKIVDNALELFSKKNTIKLFEENVKEALNNIASKQKESNDTLKSPLISVRNIVPEWGEGKLIIIAGRPGMGKTAYAFFEAFEMAKGNNPVLFFSIESGASELANRGLQKESGLSNYDFDNATPQVWEALDSTYAYIKDFPLFIDDTPLINYAYIKAKAKVFKKTKNIKALFIDYLQLIEPSDKKVIREQQISDITKSLKVLARELNIPIFLLAQLNRKLEERPSKMPELSDLRESGAIEQDADTIIFPFRPEYYWPKDPENKGVGAMLIKKNRQGKTGEASVKINKTVTSYSDFYQEISF